MSQRLLIVTHNSPDLDGIGATWLLKRFDSQHYADARFAYVNPGDTISLEEAEKFNSQLHEVTHVDTGLGEFDHHQDEPGMQETCATKLVYEYVCKLHPELANDPALKSIVEYVNQIDHFEEIFWPEPTNTRYQFMLHELISGNENVDPHNDDSQMNFGLRCFNNAYAVLTDVHTAEDIIKEKGVEFSIDDGYCLGVETRNDETIKLAQKKGYLLVIRKDPVQQNIRIKARPDASLNLKRLHQEIVKIDPSATWFYHNSGKMLLNNSRKHRNQIPSSLSLKQVIELVQKFY